VFAIRTPYPLYADADRAARAVVPETRIYAGTGAKRMLAAGACCWKATASAFIGVNQRRSFEDNDRLALPSTMTTEFSCNSFFLTSDGVRSLTCRAIDGPYFSKIRWNLARVEDLITMGLIITSHVAISLVKIVVWIIENLNQ
jgi:hypothetical protein